MIIVVGGIKGGAGKSTIAANLAVRRATEYILEEVRTVNPELKAWAFLNRADAGGTDNQDAMQMISDTPEIELIAPRVGDRKAFQNAHTQGLSVTEVKPRNQKAVKELEELYQHCFSTKVILTPH
jgi:chromosome partitioning protein